MTYKLAAAVDQSSFEPVPRFSPAYWTATSDFLGPSVGNDPPGRPALAVTSSSDRHTLSLDAVFYAAGFNAQLLWMSEDQVGHPLFRYVEDKDYRRCVLTFHWKSSGIVPLDEGGAAYIMLKGRDQSGQGGTWYAYLLQFAPRHGDPQDTDITISFDAIRSGYAFDGPTIWVGDLDSIALVVNPPVPGSLADGTPLSAAVIASVELTNVICSSTIQIGSGAVPAHALCMATDYDDSASWTPERVVETIQLLGYRGTISHYIGVSHFQMLKPNGNSYQIDAAATPLNAAAAAWHQSLASVAQARGYAVVMAFSFEQFDAYCPPDWRQMQDAQTPARTNASDGPDLATTLVSPANADAMAYLGRVAVVLANILTDAGLAPQIQIGEAWWYPNDEAMCLYDPSAQAAFSANTQPITNVADQLTPEQKGVLIQAGKVLVTATDGIRKTILAAFPSAAVLLLVDMKSVDGLLFGPSEPDANIPIGWRSAGFQILQLEDYEFVTSGQTARTARDISLMTTRLGFPIANQDLYSGFVDTPENAASYWPLIDKEAEAALARGTRKVFIWAFPQVIRDGYVHLGHNI